MADLHQGAVIDLWYGSPLLEHVFRAAGVERDRVDALVAHDAHGGAGSAVQVDHPEETLAQVAFELHLESQVVVFEAPAGTIERGGVVETDAVVEDFAAEQAVL